MRGCGTSDHPIPLWVWWMAWRTTSLGCSWWPKELSWVSGIMIFRAACLFHLFHSMSAPLLDFLLRQQNCPGKCSGTPHNMATSDIGTPFVLRTLHNKKMMKLVAPGLDRFHCAIKPLYSSQLVGWTWFHCAIKPLSIGGHGSTVQSSHSL